jgi:integrase/recombinase XerD
MACDLSSKPVRDKAIIAFLAGTGARLRETANILVKDVQIDANHSGLALLRETKLDKPRFVAFGSATGNYLVDWLNYNDWQAGRLFAVGPKGIYSAVRSASERAGTRETIKGPHDLRRLFITHWTSQRPGRGYDLILSRQVGHSSYTVTETYARNAIEDIRRYYVSPLDFLTDKQKSVG